MPPGISTKINKNLKIQIIKSFKKKNPSRRPLPSLQCRLLYNSLPSVNLFVFFPAKFTDGGDSESVGSSNGGDGLAISELRTPEIVKALSGRGIDKLFPIQARGFKKHLKRLNAPKHWMLEKPGGAFAPKPSSGPHKSRECLSLVLIIRNRLKYALTYRQVISILMQRHILVDGKVMTDSMLCFMDVVSILKTNENFRLLYDTKGRFRLHSVKDEEAKDLKSRL
ncbi:unnamed protein product [Microthlaspi erraticum]|uniref:RNA-binding S4 domain-containing protein n=1 Tax=Microthlaspi erraticum TaxID=1685480 RepID=A0A6D2K2L7_9BRAS|nr:unnamed protein product [Microthlaspi erraticum]